MTELHHFHPARKGSGSLRPFPIYPLYTQTVILSLDKPIADCFLFRRTGILLKFAQNRLEIPLCDKDATLPRRSLHIGSQVQTRGVSALCEVDRGMIRQAGGNGCARLQRASASSGTATPLGCGNLFFCYSVVIFAPLPVWSTTGIINQDY